MQSKAVSFSLVARSDTALVLVWFPSSNPYVHGKQKCLQLNRRSFKLSSVQLKSIVVFISKQVKISFEVYLIIFPLAM
ncbi:hypothetical protein KR51_00001090 [Rubidibacter lacunae KORDI 51-2]|uniref:Uncharacterized protein n=1 Tax=Rubidibacter lacunae KORDI 51-2 TaxID=582515 RepID=U5DQV1_9CHRO|nr:hypothetical protein KR51_00001090 [Rubidibacter lacunae KORDI 51-2]